MKEYRTLRMYSKELDMDKRIYVYLPNSYDKTEKHYPVLYMHDGQNLFDERIGFQNQSWHIMDLYDQYPDMPEVIVVGIESDKTRSDQLIPFPFRFKNSKKEFGGQASLYLDFITKTVKPYIDQTFRTFKNRKNTGIMGSSFGGVCSLYAALAYSDTFSRVASLSGAFHFDFYFPMKEMVVEMDFSKIKKLYMDYGTNESDDPDVNTLYQERNDELASIIKRKTDDLQYRYYIADGAVHNEAAWEKRFPDILRFLFND